MTFDRSLGQEKRRGDFPVRLPLGDESGDSLLGGRESAECRSPAADALQLCAGATRPDGGTDSIEDLERFSQGFPRFASTLRPALRYAEGEKGATTLERNIDLFVQFKRFPMGGQRVLEFSSSRREQTAATCARGERRHALESPGIALVPVEQLDGIVRTTELDQGLDLVDDKADRGRLSEVLASHEGKGRL